MKQILIALTLTGFLLLNTSAMAQDEEKKDCKKEPSDITKMICSSPSLGPLDKEMKLLLKSAVTMIKTDSKAPDRDLSALKSAQSIWVSERNNCWSGQIKRLSCVEDAYKKRMSEIEARWDLVKVLGTQAFTCANGSRFTFTRYGTKYQPAGVLKTGEQIITVVSPISGGPAPNNGIRYEGPSGTFVTIKNDQADLAMNGSKKPVKCQLGQ